MFSILAKELAQIGFYINLDESIERREFIEKQINEFNIKNLHRFSALTDEVVHYSCTKSHRAVFEYCLANNIDNVFVAEDDFYIQSKIDINNSLSTNLDTVLDSLNNLHNFDVIMFGCNPKKSLIPIGGNLAINSNSTGAWAYSINSRAMRYILDNYEYTKDYYAIDNILPELNYKGFKTVVTIPQIVSHRDGICSTLQPHIGTTQYSTWINGNWSKYLYSNIPKQLNNYEHLMEYLNQNYLVEKNITVLITGHSVKNWLLYLRYLLHSLPKSLHNCRFVICYDSFSNDDKFNLSRYFRDYDISDTIIEKPHIEYVTGGLISSLKRGLECINTDYFLWLEHDWVFLNDNIDWNNLVKAFANHPFINMVWFNKDDNNMRGFDICDDKHGSVSSYIRENRVDEVSLITTCRWSNNPSLVRTDKMRYWFTKYIMNEYVDKINQASHNIEETLIPIYRADVLGHGWQNIRDNWGTFLYGHIGDDPYVGHTDASGRYQQHNKSQPEINGENYMQKFPLLIINWDKEIQ